MNNDWLLLFPRLDCTFKEGPVPETYSHANVPPVRYPWNDFALNVVMTAPSLRVENKALWQFKEEDYVDVPETNLLIPHKEFHNFKVPGKNCMYYMQTVVPHLFSIDRKGWGGNLSVIPYRQAHTKFQHWDWMVERVENNISKFDQPSASKNELEPGYALFICQLPHDQTIQFHSNTSVEDALKATIMTCIEQKKRLVVKGHPINPASMEVLRAIVHPITHQYPYITWVDNISIHTALKGATHVFTVNSGSGIEAILHKKPIFTFGKAEYSEVAFQGSVSQFLEMASVDEYDYRNFIESYVNSLYNTRDPETFRKLYQGA